MQIIKNYIFIFHTHYHIYLLEMADSRIAKNGERNG